MERLEELLEQKKEIKWCLGTARYSLADDESTLKNWEGKVEFAKRKVQRLEGELDQIKDTIHEQIKTITRQK